eukprot:TRINITY_DN2774_c0_g1_i1.p1 TRINITY_DN2774_c0_g1~~TRINITY_DN2774_c0_g1_i1.p1  ORF type:complete len:174 (-),score=33.23 TRINITY_DN2774_c0_g1_i1:108-629(-)
MGFVSMMGCLRVAFGVLLFSHLLCCLEIVPAANSNTIQPKLKKEDLVSSPVIKGTTHQPKGDHLHIQIHLDFPSAPTQPSKLELHTDTRQTYNATLLDPRTYFVDLPRATPCHSYHVQMWSPRWTRFPQAEDVQLGSPQAGAEGQQTPPAVEAPEVYYSVLLYIVLIGGCLFI